MLAHASNKSNDINLLPFLNFNALGKTGVYLFFILSSYLLDRQIIIALQSNSTSKKYWGNYVLRRFMRIYPLFTFTLILYYVIYLFGYRYCICILNLQDFWEHMSLQSGKGVFWSIPVEFKYYFISPLIILLYKYILNWNFWYISISTFSIIILVIVYNQYTNFDLANLNLNPINYLPVFLLGSYLSFIEIYYKSFLTKISKHKRLLIDVFGFFCLMSCIILGGSFFYKQLLGKNFLLFTVFRNQFFFQGVLLTFLLFSAKHGYKLMPSLLSFKPLRFIGIISFSLYLLHYPILMWVKELSFPFFEMQLQFIVYLTMSVVFSSMTYLLIEYPFSKIQLKY